MTLSPIIPRSISLSAQLLLTFVVLVAATVTALTLVAYDTSIDELLNLARGEARRAARGRAELLAQLLALRERRADGFLAGAQRVCAEPAGQWYGWAEPCARGMLAEFRDTEGAAGAILTNRGRLVTLAGAPVDNPPPEGERWAITQQESGARYLLRAERDGAELLLEFDDSEVQAIFADPELGTTRSVFLLDSGGRPLAPAGQADRPLEFAEAMERCGGAEADGELEDTVDVGGRAVIEETIRVDELPGACVVAQVDYDDIRQPAAELRYDLFVRGITFVLGGVLLSLVAARHIAGPVRRLAGSARALQAGHFDAPVPVEGPSEVRALGRALAAMSNDLADLIAREQTGRREAEAANRSKDQFLAMLSHELRTPLTAVLGWAHTLRAAADDPERVHRAASAIGRSAEAQRRLIEDLLDVAGIAAGRVRMAPAPTTMDTVVEAALDAVAPQAEDKGVELTTAIETPRLVVYADPQRLQQIVWNLAWNAVKYTPAGGTVHIRVRAAGALAELTVSDTGMGIDPEFLPHVFGWFRREDTAQPSHEGLGLGLALVRQLVELHGGSVRAESPGRGAGSTFVVTFPLHEEGAARQERAGGRPRVSLSSVRVLVVDDDPGSREAVRVLLEQVGARVATAASAAEARRHLRIGQTDVLVSDIAMAQESGYSLMETLRTEGITIPGVALTGYARREDADKAYAAGFDVHLPKPVDPDVLVNVLAAVTGRESQR